MEPNKERFSLLQFRINKLFGKSNVTINFEDKVKIFVGENGIGKTTILNVLYYTITKNYIKLGTIDFESVELKFGQNTSAILYKEWLIPDDIQRGNIYKYIKNVKFDDIISSNDIEIYKKYIATSKSKLSNKTSEQLSFFFNDTNEKFLQNIEEFNNIIDQNVTEEVLYFPTYRRIEEELTKLGYNLDEKQAKDRENIELIKFGMGDVKKTFENIEREIKNSTLLGYSQVTGGMISHLVHAQSVNQKMISKIKDYETLNIVLDRVGEHLKESDRLRIRELVTSNELYKINDNHYNPLIFFLYNLIEIYEQHREKDDAIKKFTRVCNSYLVNKEIKYNESTVKIDVIDKRTQEPIELSNLSSGEKQIVSLFTRIYLTTRANYIILFDEPELSLSIEWQEKLLEDVLKSDRCSFLAAVTHSPFIYNNSLKIYAQSMELSITEV